MAGANSAGGVIPAFLNPRAGGAAAIAEEMRADARFDVCEIGPGELSAAVREAVEGGAKRVVVAGGDGSIAAAAAELLETGAELAVVPAGTLNHFARDLGIPLECAEALELAASGTARPVDLGVVNGRVFLNTSSVGAYVGYVQRRERLERRLPYRLASFAGGLWSFARVRTFDVDLEVDGQVRHYRTPLVFIGVDERELQFPDLGARKEGGRRGLHVIAMRGKARVRLLLIAVAAAARGLRVVSRTPHVDSFLVESCTIHLPRRLGYVALDGEIEWLESPLQYRLARGALAVVAPDQAE